MTKTCTLTIFSLLTCLFTLAALGLNAYHFNAHLYYKDKTTDTVTRETSSDTSDCPPALQIKIEGTNTVTGHEEVYIASCPWKSYTRIIGIVTFSLCQFFAVIVCLKAKGKLNSGVLGFASFIALGLLIATITLMVIDMVNGKKQYPETASSSYQPLTYILNIVFAFVGLLLGIGCTILGCMMNSNPIKTTSGHQPTQTGNNSTFVGINKSAGMEQDWKLYGNNKTVNLPTSGNDYSYSAQRNYGPYVSNGYGPYANNINQKNSSSPTNRLSGGTTLTYQSNNRENAVGYTSNHRGHIGSHLNVGGGRRREEQTYATSSIGSLGEMNYRNSLAYESRENRAGLRASNASNHHQNYKSGGDSNRVMPLAGNYRGY